MKLTNDIIDVNFKILAINETNHFYVQKLNQIGIFPNKILKIFKIQNNIVYFELNKITYAISKKVIENLTLEKA